MTSVLCPLPPGRRFDKALAHLVAAGDSHFQAALELARKHGLMRQLLRLVEGAAQQDG